MDIFGENKQNQSDDEFEFKPLTQGLGFHKKTIDLSAEIKKSNVTSQITSEKGLPKMPPTGLSKAQSQVDSVKKLVDSFPTFDQNPASRSTFVTQPLPREEIVPAFKSPRMAGVNFEEPLSQKSFNLNNADSVANTGVSPFAGEIEMPVLAKTQTKTLSKVQNQQAAISNKISNEPMAPAIKEVPFSIAAFIFDSFVVAGLGFLFTGIVLAVTKSDMSLVIINAQSDIATRISLIVLFLSVIQMYVVLSRSFFGKTIGEWAFDVQLGNSQQQKSAWYPILVGWRATLITLTGFVTLPLLSIISRRDVTAFLTGVRTYRVQ